MPSAERIAVPGPRETAEPKKRKPRKQSPTKRKRPVKRPPKELPPMEGEVPNWDGLE